MASLLKHGDTDMTEGGIYRLLIGFSVPLLIGNLFQQLYNAVDSIVVGNYVGKEALAAVGCTGPIINTLIGVFVGLATGAGVVISQFYGAKEGGKLRSAIQTSMVLTAVMCVVLTVLGVLFTPAMLRMMDTPEDVLPQATEYLRIYFWGVSGLLFYNAASGVLRAVGDTTRPLYFLIFSACANTVLDVLFVKYFNMGIAGAAYATVAAQLMSAALVLLALLREKGGYRLSLSGWYFSLGILRKICAIGIPSALQLGITAFSNIFVQSYVNRFASSCMAGWTAYIKIDSFAMLPIISLSMAMTTFVGQNLGAGKVGRVKAAPKAGIVIGYAIMLVILVPLMVFAPQLTALFNNESEVVSFGSMFIRYMSPFYLFLIIDHVYAGALRGMGNAKSAMLIMLASFVVFRQLYLYVSYRLGGGITAVSFGYPMGWMMCAVLMLAYYYGGGWAKKLSRSESKP